MVYSTYRVSRVKKCFLTIINCILQKGQEGREKFGYKDGRLNPFSSKTNREKRKNKNFMMIKHKVRAKTKRSFKDKQVRVCPKRISWYL